MNKQKESEECVKTNKHWSIEDGQVCWRTPNAELRGYDYTMLVDRLNDNDEKIADLEKELQDWQDGTIIAQWQDCEQKVKELEKQLAEKDKLINDYADEHAILQYKIASLVVKEIKAEEFAIEQLKKMENDLLDISNGWWLCFKDGTQYMTHRELEGCLKEVITKQKGEIENE